MSTKTDFQTLKSAKKSVNGRLKRLRKIREEYRFFGDYDLVVESPIQKIGCFEKEIDSMETTLLDMQNRLDKATITIPD